MNFPASKKAASFLAMSSVVLAGVLLFGQSGRDRSATADSLPAIKASRGSEANLQPYFGQDEDEHLDKTPPRLVMGLDLKRMGWTYNCMECHEHVEDPRFQRDQKFEHENIELDHGGNRYCLNCHHPENRNAFVDYDGSEIAESDVTLLCAKCHGPKYRDWKAGAHGRLNGYWDVSRGPQYKLRCIQCHDPHSPAFKPIKPMPPLTYPVRAANLKH